MRVVMTLNPLTYSLAALRQVLDPRGAAGAPGLELSLVVTAVCALVLLAASAAVANRKGGGSSA
jgi:ABC-type polysaccharide/polyol phosphate export permease